VYTTAQLDNILRGTAARYQTVQDEQAAFILEPISEFLADLVLMKDEELLTVDAAKQPQKP
jgi:hypothetical protein